LFHKLRAPAAGRSNGNGKNNRNPQEQLQRLARLAIVHVVMKSSSTAPPAAAHAEYIARDGQYQQRGGLELVESGNMPEFARDDPHSFWQAADAFERKNGRTYTELQIALPRELAPEQRHELAREATRELLGERFAYTLAVHTPLAKDNIEQPHMHLMFSERVVDSNTQTLPEEQFFKRNGAKKDPEWNAREKPMEVREKWVEMMNAAMERHGQEQRMDARSWFDQGRHDLAELVEPKLLAGSEAEARQLHAHVDALREQRAELPAPGLSVEAAAEKIEQRAELKIAEVREREASELSRLDKLIAAARELAVEVKERAAAMAESVGQRLEQFRERMSRIREGRDQKEQEQPERKMVSPAQEQQAQRAGPELVPSTDIGQKRQAFREWYTAQQKEREPVVPEQKVEPPPEQKQEQEKKPEREISRGFGLGL